MAPNMQSFDVPSALRTRPPPKALIHVLLLIFSSITPQFHHSSTFFAFCLFSQFSKSAPWNAIAIFKINFSKWTMHFIFSSFFVGTYFPPFVSRNFYIPVKL